MTARTHDHGVEELCEAGRGVYARALREGSVPDADAEDAPCLLGFGLLQHDRADPGQLRPVAPSVVLPRLLGTIEESIAQQRRRETRLADVFAPFLTIDAQVVPGVDPLAITVLDGLEHITAAITDAIEHSHEEALAIQPGRRSQTALTEALAKEQRFLSAGGRLRTLYQHTQRHSPFVLDHYEQLTGDYEVRTLDEVTDRLIVLDRTVAFVPGKSDRTLALEIRHPALVGFLVSAFDRLWRLATPLLPTPEHQPVRDGVTTRQRAIARLLVEGLTDAVIADRLGMNVRTARLHIAKLAATLGSESRAQLGYLIAESGILKPDGDLS
ncbi:helix-turn-helix transcriptional regulator [Streptomyces mangrovisoli]|uniref:Helix-turn-helix transcriptional regulator n=1 Tax=Streptomyces mangrovisoli TaxID=1428628 RepID=A0A1J4P7X2_9ACTN|nr:LuxR C-terminal-related transcriptional regulator [Streptomyces mangrovisoli]OIJ69622.1 helix-turn-helix transcriptional regulator [Streptomyces mangrovisoli]